MGFFNRLLNTNDKTKDSIWKVLTTEEELSVIIQRSHEKPMAIFKHSTRCSISSMAKSRLERNWDIPADKLDIYYLDLIQYRPTSNKIAELTEVQHQSPQVIVLNKGKAIYNASHNQISVEGIKEALDKTPQK